MSVDLMRLCWRVEWPSPAMSAVAVKLADCANDDGENVYPSVGRIERETRLSLSTVRKWLAHLEQCGVLEVVAEASGNKWNRSTTIRRFNVARLHDLTAQETRRTGRVILTPSTHVLKFVRVHVPAGQRTVAVPTAYGIEQIDIEAPAKAPNADREVEVCIVTTRGPNDRSDYDAPIREPDRQAAPPIREPDRQEGGAHPGAGCPPSGSRMPTHPGAGYNPSIEPPSDLTPSPHLPTQHADLFAAQDTIGRDRGGQESGFSRGSVDIGWNADAGAHGWARGWTSAAREAVEAIRSSSVIAHVATHLIDRCRGTLRPAKGTDAPSYVRQLASRLREISPEALAIVAERLQATRAEYLPDANTVAHMARDAAAEADRAARLRAAQAELAKPDPVFAGRWASLKRALAARLGPAIVKEWFTRCLPLGVENGRLVLITDSRFVANYCNQHFAEDLLEAGRTVFGEISGATVRVVSTAELNSREVAA